MQPRTMAKAEERKVPSVLRRWRVRVRGGRDAGAVGALRSSANALDFRVPVASPFYSTSSTIGTTKPAEALPPFEPRVLRNFSKSPP